MLNKSLDINFKALMNLIYPVDSYYITESAELDTVEKMNNYFGGTWIKVVNKFLYGADAAGQEGGEANHTLTIEEMPSHTHNLAGGDGWSGNVVGMRHSNIAKYIGCVQDRTDTPQYVNNFSGNSGVQAVQNTGGSQPHNNMPPYRTVFFYKRTELYSGGGGLKHLLHRRCKMLNSPMNPELQGLLNRISSLETNLENTQNSLSTLTNTVDNMLKTTGVKIGEFLGSKGTITLSEPITNFRIIVINSDSKDDGGGFVTSQQCLPVGYILACGYGKELSSHGRDNVSFTEKFVNANTLEFTQEYYAQRRIVYGIR